MGKQHSSSENTKTPAENYIRKYLLSGEAIQFGQTYASANICLDIVFVLQFVITSILIK